ncbi:maleylacetoacetate isomerase [Mucor mucedo]|uniref:maleylacetoacetate isomerase n=1 Tax=Mucor mucedo TaxID=29922 RepID=UPI002220A77A|nr:maleylacetoacetate isomerase [Mucor mucedo]KAI7892136.1 maleylacetoacetate isomerase [Mucor mucedo]
MSTEQTPVLYAYYRSSASWRVRIALAWKGIDFELKPIDLFKQQQKTEEYTKIVPTQKVPALITKEGKTLSQSQAILEYLEEAYPERPMLPKCLYARAEVREICQIVACDIHPIQNLGVLIRVAGKDLEKRAEWARESIELGFKGLEARLELTSGIYCVGNSITMADFFVTAMVGNAKRWSVDMTAFPILTRINNTLSTLPEFIAASPFHQPDCPPDLKE